MEHSLTIEEAQKTLDSAAERLDNWMSTLRSNFLGAYQFNCRWIPRTYMLDDTGRLVAAHEVDPTNHDPSDMMLQDQSGRTHTSWVPLPNRDTAAPLDLDLSWARYVASALDAVHDGRDTRVLDDPNLNLCFVQATTDLGDASPEPNPTYDLKFGASGPNPDAPILIGAASAWSIRLFYADVEVADGVSPELEVSAADYNPTLEEFVEHRLLKDPSLPSYLAADELQSMVDSAAQELEQWLTAVGQNWVEATPANCETVKGVTDDHSDNDSFYVEDILKDSAGVPHETWRPIENRAKATGHDMWGSFFEYVHDAVKHHTNTDDPAERNTNIPIFLDSNNLSHHLETITSDYVADQPAVRPDRYNVIATYHPDCPDGTPHQFGIHVYDALTHSFKGLSPLYYDAPPFAEATGSSTYPFNFSTFLDDRSRFHGVTVDTAVGKPPNEDFYDPHVDRTKPVAEPSHSGLSL